MNELKERTYWRSIALQALYENDLSDHTPDEILEGRFDLIDIEDEGKAFIYKIFHGVLDHMEEIDEIIRVHAPEWPLEQVAVVDRNIIRIALYEFAVSDTTPVQVACNEAVELAKCFSGDSSPRFVNGVLGSISESLHKR